MTIKNVIALEEVATDIKIAELVVVAVLDLRQNPSNIVFFISNRKNEEDKNI